MSDTKKAYLCALCGKKKPGRFTRRKDAAGGGFSQGFTLPAWNCWTCVPAGEGRGETGDEMPKKTPPPAAVSSALTVPDLTSEKAKAVAVLPGLETEVGELTITDDASYQYADTLLGRIDTARKVWGGIWDRIQEKTIKPIRAGLEGLYEVNREVDKPMETLRGRVVTAMKAYKTAELRRIQDAERAKQQEAQRLANEAAAKERAAEVATTPQMQGRLYAQAARLGSAAVAVATREAPAPVAGFSSSTRKVKRVHIVGLAEFYQGLADGIVNRDFRDALDSTLQRLYKESPAEVLAWPGIEVHDEIQIVGR